MEEEKEFQVRDRRAHLSGEAAAPEKASEKKPSAGEKPQPASRPEPSGHTATRPEEGAFPVNFSSFILSLATSALIHLGEEANPATGEKSVQLPMARQVIDLLSLLEAKTKGNLSKEEEALIAQVLFTLRMKFVETEKKRRP